MALRIWQRERERQEKRPGASRALPTDCRLTREMHLHAIKTGLGTGAGCVEIFTESLTQGSLLSTQDGPGRAPCGMSGDVNWPGMSVPRAIIYRTRYAA